MSDEYGRKSFKESLVDDSLNRPTLSIDERTKNYPTEGDTTSSGGFGTTENMWAGKAQRGDVTAAQERDSTGQGLIDQSVNGTDLTNEIQDAKQGEDKDTRR